uniref:Uncharacterized protein n=1 Tax=Knipowitschia caucasica TaxID=637954 RepID=A0AAV2KZD3_KNICA
MICSVILSVHDKQGSGQQLSLRPLPRGQSPRLASSCLTSLWTTERAGLWITRAAHKQSHFPSPRREPETKKPWPVSAAHCANFLQSHAPSEPPASFISL